MTKTTVTDPFLIRLRPIIDADPNMTDASLSVAAGLDNSTIRRLYKTPDASPKLSTAMKICAALGTTLEEFMSEAHTPEEQEIVRLTMQLPDHLRRELLGYAKGLAAASGTPPKEDPEGGE